MPGADTVLGPNFIRTLSIF